MRSTAQSTIKRLDGASTAAGVVVTDTVKVADAPTATTVATAEKPDRDDPVSDSLNSSEKESLSKGDIAGEHGAVQTMKEAFADG